MPEVPQHDHYRRPAHHGRTPRAVRRRAGSAFLATLASAGIAAAVLAGTSTPASARHLSGKVEGRSDLASYQQFARCMQTHGYSQWPNANPAHPYLFAFAPQAAAGSKQRLGQTARTCSAIAGNGDVLLTP